MDQIVAWLDDVLEYKHTVGWLLTPAYPEGLDRLGEKTSDEMYYEISGCTQRVMAETSVDIMLPARTGIQNARTTSLDTLGLYGHLSTDGIHLSDGIPRLIENYIVTQTLLNLLGLNNSIDDDFMSID